MKTIQLKVHDNYFDTVMLLLNNLKIDIIKELKVVKNSVETIKTSKSDRQMKELEGIISIKSKDAITLHRGTIFCPYDELSRDIS